MFNGRLTRLINYCNDHQIAPDQVNAATFERFRVALESESFVKSQHTVYREACLNWNLARATIPGWPALTIAVPSVRRRYALDWSNFPAYLQADVEAYLHRTGNSDLFADDYAPPAGPLL